MMRQDLQTVRDDLQRMQPEFATVLGNVRPERFVRVTLTAIQRKPELLNCSRRSLFLAIQQCAEDGLMPDGKQAVLVAMGKEATYIPMVRGILKKIREGMDIADIMVETVRLGDIFSYSLGDNPRITHEPDLDGSIDRPFTHIYSIVKQRDGSVSRCVMTWQEIIAIRDRYVRAKSGPWFDSTSIGEMGKKTVIRRHSKLLDTTPEIERVLERDDSLYDMSQFKGHLDEPPPRAAIRTIGSTLDAFANEDEAETFGNKEEYVHHMQDLIDRADDAEKIKDVRKFWSTTQNLRDSLGVTKEEQRILSRHIRVLALADDEPGESDAVRPAMGAETEN